MKQSQKTLLTIVLPIIFVVGGLVVLSKTNQPGGDEYVGFAQCLTERGATFYGAYWCPHCQAQKKLFGSAADELNYVECALPGGNSAGQTQVCKDANIQSYPTWEFADGERQTGEMSLSQLATKTGCELPDLSS